MSNPTQQGGLGLSGVLFVVFLVLRLTDHIDWAWYWIAAPLWVPIGVALALFVTVVPVVLWLEARDTAKFKRKLAEAKARRGLV